MSATIKLATRDGEHINTPPERRGGFVPVPNAIFDALLSSDMTLKQHRVVQAVLRLTFGYGEPNGAELTITAIARRANMARPHASKAFGELVEAGVLSAERSRSGLVVRVNDPAYWAMARLSLCVERKRPAECEAGGDEVEAAGQTENQPPYRIGTVVPNRDVQPYRIGTPNNIQVLHTNTPPISPPSETAAADVPMAPVETDTPAVGSASGREAAPARRRGKRAKLTFSAFLAECRQLGVSPISPDDPVFARAEQVGLDDDLLRMAWLWFKHTYGDGGLRREKKYIDWRAVFREAVFAGWHRLWWVNPQGERLLTTAGREFQMRLEAASREGAQ